jgi:hypothetical protein
MKTFAISIPKPCHEDWNKMTPDAKGAFCASCQKSVYDFSKKTDEEIIAVFEKEEKGKVCGRFTPAQLSQPIVSYGNPSTTSRLAIFAYALLMVFGAALFNGAEAFGQERPKGEVHIRMGKVAYQPIKIEEVKEVEKIEKDTVIEVKQPKAVKCGLNKTEDTELLTLGQMIMIETPHVIVEEPVDIKMGEVEFVEPEMLTGDTVYQELPLQIAVDTMAIEEFTVIDTVALIEIEPVVYALGGVSYVEVIEPEPIQIVETPLDTTEITNVPGAEVGPIEDTTEDKLPVDAEKVILPRELEVSISPNPTSGQITLSYTLENTMAVRIELFDITGKMVKTLSNQGKQYAGKYNVSYTISDLPNGIYMATLTTEENKVTTKIVLTR